MSGTLPTESEPRVPAPTGAPPAGCTIIFRNYLSHARILAKSFLRHVPGGRFYLLVLDGLPKGVRGLDGVHLIQPEELPLSYFYELCFKYDVTELSTAVKPSLLSLLLNRYAEDRVAYFDPDIQIMRPLPELWKLLDAAQIVLTPHLLKPIPLDGKRPSEQDIMLSGAYNLGFISVRKSEETSSFLRWWEERLRDHCRIDHARALFTDQRWIDLAPGYFPSVAILRDPSYNVAYWNLHERELERRRNLYLINDRPLAFFHYSGFDPRKPDVLSKHQTRTVVKTGSALADLLARYASLHKTHGFATSNRWTRGFSRFSNGVPVHALLRQLYCNMDEATRASFGNPFDTDAPNSFLAWATRPLPGDGQVSPFVQSIYHCRYDVAAAFPVVPGKDSARLVLWARSKGSLEMSYDPRLVRDANPVSTTTGAPAKPVAAPPRPAVNLPYPQLVRQFQELLCGSLPEDAHIVVISKGDDRLVTLKDRAGWHYPQTSDGRYAGYYPADSEAAIAHLEALRGKGADYFVIPQTAFWWLDFYTDLRQHLKRHYRLQLLEPNLCAVFALQQAPSESECEGATLTLLDDLVRPHPQPRTALGVNVAGYLASEKGVGEAVRAGVRALRAAGVPLALNDFADTGSANLDRSHVDVSDTNPHPVNLVFVNADQVKAFALNKGPAYFENHYNIGFWNWELSDFPPEWSDAFAQFNEIWAPSCFAQDSVARLSPIPVVRMPLCLPPPPTRRAGRRRDFDLPSDTFVFLFMFDFHSFTERKNPLGLIQAFRRAFRPDDNVLLLLKCSHADYAPSALAGLRRAAGKSRVRFVDAVMPRNKIDALVGLCDCYVSLHRSEGFGLTLAEAMQLGKPVIATGYSGNMDFMTPGNSYLTRYQLIEIEETHGPYRKGAIWADPDLEHAAEQMRDVYTKRDQAKTVGRQAQLDIARHLSPQTVGQLYKARLLRTIPRTPNVTNVPTHAPARKEGQRE